jgi:molybdopterin-guanine dinucleotide biosynthesis protein A
LKEKFENIESVPIYNLDEIEEMSNNIQGMLIQSIAEIDGLVLIGGKSSRMGTDKSKLKYYGKDHSLHLADLLKNKTVDTYLSVRDSKDYAYPVIKDRFIDLGPFGAICSAFLKNPNKAYFVLATDLPYINEDLISLLIKNRDTSKVATTVKGMSKEFPEPLITIWEPRAYPILLSYLAQGISCPRKVLINSDVKVIEVADKLIANVNTPEEYSHIKNTL